MPWGKHKGEKIINVPATYLLWLESDITEKVPLPRRRTLEQKNLLKYIDDNREILIKEDDK